ncbi:MAG: DUF1697 domain-containing protein [Bacteroidota bacterium]
MTQQVILLRGINVSGKNKLKMADLRSGLEGLGFQGVATYVQSGNVVLKSTVNPEESAAMIQAWIKEKFGYEVFVQAYANSTFRSILTKNPFVADLTKDPAFFHVTLLATDPQPWDALLDRRKGEEDLQVLGRTVYLYCPHGYGRTKLTNNDIERICKSSCTTRNWKTMNQLQSMLDLE